ncbi:hypothetical protein PVAP13_2NG014500 [Panicum virgatum]|uniref:Uncharacterized protein n=1 Tax=Panicum virgatum TaxID=38727 RepID=A0A8T0VES9_PANVG|nr:hypothetical protein PVAP13_2NG014500 [Panicum virgatum]
MVQYCTASTHGSVLYLDNMDFGPLNHIHLPMPHVCCYEDRLLRQLIEADKWPWNFFGQSKPRNARSVCYSRGVRMKAPTNQTNADEGCSDSRKDQLSLEVSDQEQRPTRCGLRWKVTSRRRKIAHHVPISSHPPSEGIFIGHGESPGLAEYEQSSNVACAVVVHEDLFGTILENNMTHPDTTDMEAVTTPQRTVWNTNIFDYGSDGPLYLGYDTVQQQGNGIRDLGMDLSLMETGCSNGEYQDHHQPESPEYTLQHSISEKFTIRRLFACLGISADRDSSNNTPEHTMVVQPMTNGEAAGGTEPTMMVDNYADGAVWSCPSPTKVVEIGSEDTDLASHEHHYDSDISNTNMEPDIEIIE